MLQGLKDYAKSVYANKFTLAGYIAGAATAGGILIAQDIEMAESMEAIVVGVFMVLGTTTISTLVSTDLGFSTRWFYRKTRTRIEKHGTLDQRLVRKAKLHYCYNQGMKMAAKEAGLERLLN